jgi:hypothetical protein
MTWTAVKIGRKVIPEPSVKREIGSEHLDFLSQLLVNKG